MSGKEEQKQTQNQTSTQSVVRAPYGPGEAALNKGLGDALSMYNSNKLAPYVGMDERTVSGLNQMDTAAQAGAGGLNNAFNAYSDFASGKYTDPYQDENYRKILDSASERATTGVNMMAGSRGRYGSDFHQGTLARELGNLEADFGYRHLQDERGRQMAAAGALPSAFAATMMPGQARIEVGRAFEADLEAQANQQANNLAALMAILGAAEPYGSATTKGDLSGTVGSTTQKPTNWAGIAGGGALTLASLLA
ncbi:hypothetical protein [Mesorhizobium sp. Z1-4]|uniref:hypothetical protein n=1 Tax=Mesorhizobium sp. Z1-4 TaxID=2448478 RepID=UPI000FDB8F2D|nr:hypothetical protein [Mesorhizobium sp. Z1-4]